MIKARYSYALKAGLIGAGVLLTATIALSQTEVTSSPVIISWELRGGVFVAPSQAIVTSNPVFVFGDRAVVPGASSTVLRDGSGVTATFHTSSLEPGGAHTFWLAIFNLPENCTPPSCGTDDVMMQNAAAGTSLVNVGGQLIRQYGKANFGARLNVGDTTGALFGPGLVSPFGAEIHLVVQAHGQPGRGFIDEQISIFDGGCPPNTRANAQVSVHPPQSPALHDTVRLGRIETELDVIKHLLDAIGRRVGANVP